MYRRIKSNKSLSAIIYTLLNHQRKTRQTIRHPLLFRSRYDAVTPLWVDEIFNALNFVSFSFKFGIPFCKCIFSSYKFNCATSQDLLSLCFDIGIIFLWLIIYLFCFIYVFFFKEDSLSIDLHFCLVSYGSV